jgi:hypothetical protein
MRRVLSEFAYFRFEQEISTELMKSSRPMFVPSQVKQFNAYNTAPQHSKTMSRPPMPIHHHHNHPAPSFNSTFQQISQTASIEKGPIILSSAPKLYTRPNVPTSAPTAEIQAAPAYSMSSGSTVSTSSSSAPTVGPNFDMNALQFEVSSKSSSKKSKVDKNQQNLNAEDIIKAAKASSALQSFGTKDKRKVDKKTVRQAGGITWEDQSLADWPEDDFRIFCGDLGNDVNDELLTRTFSKFPSFQRAKVIRDRRTNKTRGYGFISFKEPVDFIKAMKEFDGRYVGSRPIKLRKSTWKQRGIEERKKKEHEKKMLLDMVNKF